MGSCGFLRAMTKVGAGDSRTMTDGKVMKSVPQVEGARSSGACAAKATPQSHANSLQDGSNFVFMSKLEAKHRQVAQRSSFWEQQNTTIGLIL